jgi:hypothetical protein
MNTMIYGLRIRYANAAESVGYHADQLTYLGPHPTIASISLGCEREVFIPGHIDLVPYSKDVTGREERRYRESAHWNSSPS